MLYNSLHPSLRHRALSKRAVNLANLLLYRASRRNPWIQGPWTSPDEYHCYGLNGRLLVRSISFSRRRSIPWYHIQAPAWSSPSGLHLDIRSTRSTDLMCWMTSAARLGHCSKSTQITTCMTPPQNSNGVIKNALTLEVASMHYWVYSTERNHYPLLTIPSAWSRCTLMSCVARLRVCLGGCSLVNNSPHAGLRRKWALIRAKSSHWGHGSSNMNT
jgi:hypothetical protein